MPINLNKEYITQPVQLLRNAGVGFEPLDGTLAIDPDTKERFMIIPGLPPINGAPDHRLTPHLQRWKELAESFIPVLHSKIQPYLVPRDAMCTAVREIYDAFDRIKSLEVDDPNYFKMQKRWERLRDILCFFLQQDLPYRWRFQLALSGMDMEKIRLDESDRFWLEKQGDFQYGGDKR